MVGQVLKRKGVKNCGRVAREASDDIGKIYASFPRLDSDKNVVHEDLRGLTIAFIDL